MTKAVKLRNIIVGKALQVKRETLRFTRSELARKLGIRPQFVSNWERGTSYPPMDRLARIVKLFKLNKKHILELYIEETTSEKIKEFHAAMKIK